MKNLWFKIIPLVVLEVGILSAPVRAELMYIQAFVKGMD